MIISGTFAEDTLRRIRDPQNKTLDDVIKIHEEFCDVVFSTASVYSVWFLLHLITFSVGYILFSTKFLLDMNRPLSEFNMKFILNGLVLLYLLYIFVTPFIFAARISSDCAGKIPLSLNSYKGKRRPTRLNKINASKCVVHHISGKVSNKKSK